MAFISSIFQQGGLLVYPLILLLIAALVIIIYKGLQLRRNSVISPAIVERVEQFVLDNKATEATAYCKQNSTPMSRVLMAGILNYEKSEGELKETLEESFLR